MVTVNEKVGRGLVCVGEHWSKNGAIDADISYGCFPIQ